jgi:hypothetical protein
MNDFAGSLQLVWILPGGDRRHLTGIWHFNLSRPKTRLGR